MSTHNIYFDGEIRNPLIPYLNGILLEATAKRIQFK